MALYSPRPKVADGVILFATVCLMGAPSVFGQHMADWLGYALFYGGLSGMVLYVLVRWGTWLFGLSKTEGQLDARLDNRGGNYVGRDNAGQQTVYHGPVTIHNAIPSEGDFFNNLRSLSSPKLRQLALTFASELRAFEADHRERDDIRRAKEWGGRRPDTEDQRHENWQAAREADDLARAAYTKAFNTRFLPKAVALKNKLCELQGISSKEATQPPYDSVAIDNGMLAGVNPVGEAARVIETLALKLQ